MPSRAAAERNVRWLRGNAPGQDGFVAESSQAAPVFAAIGLLREEDVIAKARFDFSERGIRGPPVL